MGTRFLLASYIQLIINRKLIEEFIKGNLSFIQSAEHIPNEFEEFWGIKQKENFEKLCREEKKPPEKVSDIIEK